MPRPIKLLMITHNYPRFQGDFAGVFISLLARPLPALGIEPIILAPHAPDAAEFEETDGVKVYRFRYAPNEKDENLAYHGNMHKLVLGSVSGIFKFKHFLDCFRKAAIEIIEKEQIDALAGHWLIPSGMVMKKVNRSARLPTFMYSHGTDVRLVRKYSRVAYRYLKDFCLGLKRWKVPSSYLRDEIVAMDSRLDAIVEVLPVPQDETTFDRDPGIIGDNNLIVSVTRFTQQKRVDQLIRAFALVAEKNRQAKLEIYGGGPLRDEVNSLIIRLGLQGKVHLNRPIPQSELRSVYNKAAVVVLNSVQEGFGLALSEAMLCGTAVVGTNSGGITDIIQHEKRGLLVEPDQPPELALALLRLLEDSATRNRLAENGYRFARATYASQPLAARYADIIKSAFTDL